MAVRYLHCPNCGDPWRRIRWETFVRVGPPRRQCRVCQVRFETGEVEWPNLKWGRRLGFLAQNVLKVLPFGLLFAATLPICDVFGLVPRGDMFAYSLFAGVVLLGLLTPLMAWSTLQIMRSIARAYRDSRRPPAQVDSKFISDAAWERAQLVRPRFAPPPPVFISATENRREVAGEIPASRKAEVC